MTKTENYEKVFVDSSKELRIWLDEHHDSDKSFWLVTYKKDTPSKYITVDEVLDELLRYGWIDGIRRKLDNKRTMQLISKRKTQYWAKSYKDRVARLTQEGKMHESGLKSVEEAKRSDLWSFMDDVDALITPNDLATALDEKKAARKHFEAYPNAYKRNVLRWLKLAKTEKTRKSRISKICQSSAKNSRIPQM